MSSTGLTYLAFLDRDTSTYWRGTYDQIADHLDIKPAKTESMLRQFADANGLRLGDNIPEWSMHFDPHDNVRVDFNNRTVNTFQLSEFMRTAQPKRKVINCPPMIFKIISHVLCGDIEAIEHFMNWLACIIQTRPYPHCLVFQASKAQARASSSTRSQARPSQFPGGHQALR